MKPAVGFPYNCGSIIGANSPVYSFKKPSITKDKFILTALPINRITAGVSGSITTIQDAQIYNFTSASTITDYIINIQYLTNENFPINIISMNSGVLQAPSINKVASGVSAGTTTLIGYGIDDSIFGLSLNVTQVGGTIVNTLQSYVTNSVSKNCVDSIDSRIFSKNPTTSKNIFTSQDHTSANYQRNTNCWCSDLDLTPLSPWNSRGANTRAGTLISPRHVLFAAHYPLLAGDVIRFVTQNNTVITKTITNTMIHPLFNGFGYDVGIGLLDSDVPNSIGFVKILPSNWNTKMPTFYSNAPYSNIPVLYVDQDEKALVYDWYYSNANNVLTGYAVVGFKVPSNLTRLSFYDPVVGGDSGNPIVLIINNQLVLLTVFTTSGSGTFITYYKNDINAMMTTLGGGYQLTEIDLSSFPSY